MTDGAIDRLKEMVNKPFLYQNEEVVILNYCDGTGDDGTEVEIYLNEPYHFTRFEEFGSSTN